MVSVDIQPYVSFLSLSTFLSTPLTEVPPPSLTSHLLSLSLSLSHISPSDFPPLSETRARIVQEAGTDI